MPDVTRTCEGDFVDCTTWLKDWPARAIAAVRASWPRMMRMMPKVKDSGTAVDGSIVES